MWQMEIFMGIPSQTFPFTIQLKRESELVLTSPEEPFPLIIITFLSFCYSSHTDGFVSSSAREKRMNSCQWVPLSRIIWRINRTDLRASQNLFPHPIPNVSQEKPSKAGRGLSLPPVHRNDPETPNAAVLIHLPCAETAQLTKHLRLAAVPVPGVQCCTSWGQRWASPGCVGAKLHSFSSRRVRLHPCTRCCAHTFTLLTHSGGEHWHSSWNNVFSRSSGMCACLQTPACWMPFLHCKGTFPNPAMGYCTLPSSWMLRLGGFCSGSKSFLQSATKVLLLQFHLSAKFGEKCYPCTKCEESPGIRWKLTPDGSRLLKEEFVSGSPLAGAGDTVKVSKDTKDFNTVLCGPGQGGINASWCSFISSFMCSFVSSFICTAAFCSIVSEVFTPEAGW